MSAWNRLRARHAEGRRTKAMVLVLHHLHRPFLSKEIPFCSVNTPTDTLRLFAIAGNPVES